MAATWPEGVRKRVMRDTTWEIPVNVIAGKGDLPICQYLGKEFIQMQIMVNLLEGEISDIFQPGLGGYIPGSNQLLFEIDLELNFHFAFFDLFIKQPDLLLCVRQGVVCDGKQLRVLADPFYILSGDLFSVAYALLNEVCGIFCLVVVPELHAQHLRMKYKTIIPHIAKAHNTKQHNIKENFAKK